MDLPKHELPLTIYICSGVETSPSLSRETKNWLRQLHYSVGTMANAILIVVAASVAQSETSLQATWLWLSSLRVCVFVRACMHLCMYVCCVCFVLLFMWMMCCVDCVFRVCVRCLCVAKI